MYATFAASDVKVFSKNGLHFLWFWHFDSERELERNQRCQIKQSEGMERLRFYDAAVHRISTLQLLSVNHPKRQIATVRAWYVDKAKFCQPKCLHRQLLSVHLLFTRVHLIRGFLISWLLWRFIIVSCLSIQTIVIHRNRDENKLLLLKTMDNVGKKIEVL